MKNCFLLLLANPKRVFLLIPVFLMEELSSFLSVKLALASNYFKQKRIEIDKANPLNRRDLIEKNK